MAVEITSVTPGRGRWFDTVTINGSGFNTTLADNTVLFGTTSASIVSASATVLVVEVPFLLDVDVFTVIVVINEDNDADQASIPWFAQADLSTLKSARIPGQVPGPGESITGEQPDVPTAKRYMRLVQLAEWLRDEVITGKGDIMTRGASDLMRHMVGGDGCALEAQSADPSGLRWTPTRHRVTLPWGREIQAGETTLLALAANGHGATTATDIGEHVAPFNGIIDRVWALVEEEGSTDTLSQVTVAINGVTAHDSGTGLARAQDQQYTASTSIAVRAGQRIEMRTLKSGSAAAMRIIAGLRIVQRVADPRDAVEVSDAIVRACDSRRTIADTVTTSDTIAAELS